MQQQIGESVNNATMDTEEAPSSSLAILQNIVEEIPSGVSMKMKTSLLGNEVVESLAQTVTSELKNKLQFFWSEFDVEKKLEDKKKLPEMKYHKNITSTDKMNWKRYQNLLQIKRKLEDSIFNLKNESTELKQDLEAQSKVMEHQIEMFRVNDGHL